MEDKKGQENFRTDFVVDEKGETPDKPHVITFMYKNHKGQKNYYDCIGPMTLSWKIGSKYHKDGWTLCCYKKLWYEYKSNYPNPATVSFGWAAREFLLENIESCGMVFSTH